MIARAAAMGAGAAVVGAAFALPWWANPGMLFLAGLTLIQALFALSWNLLFGYAGLASFGHAGFFAIGAYFTGACLKYKLGIPFPFVLALAGLSGAAVAWLIGIVALRRLAGIFLAVLTVALSEVLRLIIGYTKFLGREDGLNDIPRPIIDLGLLTLDLTSSEAYFVFLLAACSLLTAMMWWLVHSRFGRTFQTIRQDAERAAFIGTNVSAYRIAAFMISGALAAIAGGLFAPWTRIVTTDEVHWLMSIQPMLNTLLGGVGSFWGPIVGAMAFAAINYGTRTFVGLAEVIVGGILLLVILVAPHGLLGLVAALRARMVRGHPAAAPLPERQR
ncbi:MAG TPA: branched-chain amino acid ABC transporter permease [Burkholderiales bacterium]|nr:branched-chain amino acid ABC transporter permease [Burkholderiales bacterium]